MSRAFLTEIAVLAVVLILYPPFRHRHHHRPLFVGVSSSRKPATVSPPGVSHRTELKSDEYRAAAAVAGAEEASEKRELFKKARDNKAAGGKSHRTGLVSVSCDDAI